jgi:hypothetical protein
MIGLIKAVLNSKSGVFIFLIFLVIHLIPLFSVDILLTLDGPSHLYNAKLFNEILAGNESISELYQINSELVPNYFGHLILSLLLWVSTPILTLKTIHFIYVVGIAFAFRLLVLELRPQNGKMSILIFPLIYSAPFISGFYNFSLALILLLFTLYFWFKNRDQKGLFFYIKLAVLLTITYLSHSFTFGVLCLSLAIIIISEKGIRNYKSWIIEGVKVFGAALIPFALAISFVIARKAEYSYLTSEELWYQISNYKFIYAYENDSSFWVLSYVLFSLLGSVFFKKKEHLSLIYIALVLFGLYFYLPDGVGYASVFSVRTLMLGFLFFIFWLAIQKRNRFIEFIIIGLLFFYQNHRMNELIEWGIVKSVYSLEILKVAELIPENSIIKPIRALNTWQYFHISNFLGVNKPQIILENYEASHDYFPVKWKYNLEDRNKSQKNDFFHTTLNKKTYLIDYLLVIGLGKVESEIELKQIEIAKRNFSKVYQSDFITLYKVEFK